jgi:hypothetical protein
MPMDIEFCATCGCSEFSHNFVEHECDDTCDEDCVLADDDLNVVCECGACDDYTWMENPQGAVCQCGCPEHQHARAHEARPADCSVGADADSVDVDELEPACEGCDSCGGYVEWGSELEQLREQLADRGTEWPHHSQPSSVSSSTIRLSWIDEPLEIVGALVADAAGQSTRCVGLPRPENAVFVYFAVTHDGLEIAVTADEITGVH